MRFTWLVLLAVVCVSSLISNAQVASSSHVFIVMEEAHSYSSVIGSSSMPYLNSLLPSAGLATKYYANSHPSIGNYFFLTTGQLISNDTYFAGPVSADNIVRELVANGKFWKTYAEALPSVGYTGLDKYPYLKSHNPMAYFTDVLNSSIQAANMVSFSQFASDLANNNLPNFSFIVPSVQDDGAGCPAGTSSCTDSQILSNTDSWLKNNIGPLISSPVFQQDGILIIVFAQSYSTDVAFGGGQVAMLLLGPKVKPGYTSTTFYQHQNTLRLVCDALGVTSCPGSAASTTSMAEFFLGTPPPPAKVSTGAIWFNKQALGIKSGIRAVQLTNTQATPLSISSIVTSGDFAQTNNCGAILAGAASCTINVTFTPTAVGMRTGTLTITDDATNSPQTVALGGTGILPVTVTPSSLSFGNQNLGTTSSPLNITVTNNESVTLTNIIFNASGNFAQTNTCGISLAPNTSCTVSVTYSPFAPADDAGTVTISDSSVTSPHVVNLSGTGIDKVILAPSAVSFGEQSLGTTSSPRTVIVRNNQVGTLNISNIAIAGDFAQTNTCGSGLAPNSTCIIKVTYTPTVTGNKTGTVTLSDDASTVTPQVINLTGYGVGACSVNPTNRTVTICTPFDGSTVNAPVHINAVATDSNPLSQFKIYVDSVGVYTVTTNTLDTYLRLTPGSHRISVIATETSGYSFKQVINVTAAPSPLSKIRHIIYFVQENRSFDTYFGRFGAYRQSFGYNDAFDGIPLSVVLYDKSGKAISPFHERTVCTDSLNPGWNESHRDVDGGLMDKFMIYSAYSTTNDPNGQRAMGYYDWTELNYYYPLMLQYATSDRFFSSLLSGTQPNRQYLYAATSFGHVGKDLPPTSGWTQPTIFDKLLQTGVSWRYYYQTSTQIDLKGWATFGKATKNLFPISQYYIDLQNESTLPSVIFLERGAEDEHPGRNLQPGAALTKQFIDALMKSPSWASSVFVFAFDEGGGLYDHVPPVSVPLPDNIPSMISSTDFQASFNQTGFRIPFFIVSPWVKPHFVSHQNRELTSILKLIESRFGLTPLTARDAWADDMGEFFDFTAPNLAIPSLPAQSLSGKCQYDLSTAP